MKRFFLIGAFGLMLICIGAISVMGGMAMNSEMHYSEDQRRILLAAGAPEERIASGRLMNSEKRLLEALKQAQTYLSARYPEDRFSFIRMDNSAPRQSVYLFTVVSEANGDETFAVKVERENGNAAAYHITESYYSDLKKTELCELVKNKLAQMGVIASCDLEIVGLYDDAYRPEQSLEDTLDSGLVIDVSGWAYAAMPASLSEVKPDIESVLQAAGLCGGFRLQAVEGISLDEAAQRIKTDKSLIAEEVYISLSTRMSEVK